LKHADKANGENNNDNDVLTQPEIKTAIIYSSHVPSLRNSVVATILNAAEEDRGRAAADKIVGDSSTTILKPEPESVVIDSTVSPITAAAAPTSWLARLREADAKRYGHSAGAREEVNGAAGAMHSKPKCGHGHGQGRMDVAGDKGSGGEKERVIYMHASSYVKRDYTDVLIVGIVIMFIAAIVLVEALEKFVGT
jgi:hypothetical protein